MKNFLATLCWCLLTLCFEDVAAFTGCGMLCAYGEVFNFTCGEYLSRGIWYRGNTMVSKEEKQFYTGEATFETAGVYECRDKDDNQRLNLENIRLSVFGHRGVIPINCDSVFDDGVCVRNVTFGSSVTLCTNFTTYPDVIEDGRNIAGVLQTRWKQIDSITVEETTQITCKRRLNCTVSSPHVLTVKSGTEWASCVTVHNVNFALRYKYRMSAQHVYTSDYVSPEATFLINPVQLETTATLPTSTASVMSTTDVVSTSVTTIPTIPTDELTSEELPTILIVVGVIVIIISMILITVFISIICICVKFRKNKYSSNYIKPRISGSLQHIKGMEMFESGPPVRQTRVDPVTVQEEGEGSHESGLTSEHCGPLLSQSVTPMSDRTVYMESPTLKEDSDSPSSVLTPPPSLPLDKKTRPVSPSQLAAGSRGIIPTSPHPHSVSPMSDSVLSSQSDVVSHPTLVSRPGNLDFNNLSSKKSEMEEDDDVEELDESLFHGGLTGPAPYIRIN